MSQQFFSSFYEPRNAPLSNDLKSILSERMASVIERKGSFFEHSSSPSTASNMDEVHADKLLKKKNSFTEATECLEDCLPSNRLAEELLYFPSKKSSIHGSVYTRMSSAPADCCGSKCRSESNDITHSITHD